jgi:hypothetical protein
MPGMASRVLGTGMITRKQKRVLGGADPEILAQPDISARRSCRRGRAAMRQGRACIHIS